MKCELSQEQIASYRANGFLAIEGFFDEEELAAWRTGVERAVAARFAMARRLDGFEGAIGELIPEGVNIRPEVWPSQLGFTQCMNVWQTDEGMAALLHDERIGRMAAELAGVDGIRVWYDQTFVKRPWAGPTPLHQDVPYWSFYSTDALTIWVALDDVDVSNGALCYLPGTHLTADWKQAEDITVDSIFDVHPEWRDIEPVFCPLRAGGVLWHNGLTVHGSGANLSPRPRRAINCAFMPDGATFNGQQNVLPDEVFARYRIGDVLDDDERNPLIYSRSAIEGARR